jgi:hypothetical protein
MRSAVVFFIGAILALPILAENSPGIQPVSPCASNVSGAPACNVSKHDLKSARAAFKRGMKLQSGRRFDEALQQFDTAANLIPNDVEFATARELARQQLIYNHIERGNTALASENEVRAMAEVRQRSWPMQARSI